MQKFIEQQKQNTWHMQKQAVKNFDEVDPKIIEIAKKFVELVKTI